MSKDEQAAKADAQMAAAAITLAVTEATEELQQSVARLEEELSQVQKALTAKEQETESAQAVIEEQADTMAKVARTIRELKPSLGAYGYHKSRGISQTQTTHEIAGICLRLIKLVPPLIVDEGK